MPGDAPVLRSWRDWCAALTSILRPAPGLFAVQAILALIGGVAPPLSAWALSRLLGSVANHARSSEVVLSAAAMAVAAAIVPTSSVFSRFTQAESGRRAVVANKSDLAARVNAISDLGSLESPVFLDRLRLSERAGTTAPQLFGVAVFGGLRALVTTIGFVTALSWSVPGLIALATVACGFGALVARADVRRRLSATEQVSARTRRELFYAGLLTDTRAAMEIRLFGSGGLLHSRMLHEVGQAARTERRADRAALTRQLQLAIVTAILTAAGLIWAAGLAGLGRLDVAELSVAVTATAGLQVSGTALITAVADGSRAAALFGHFVRHPPRPVLGPAGPSTPELGVGVEFRDVWFCYPDASSPVLRGVNLFIPAGETIALVGANGAGKSTLIKLLCRLYEPTAGRILWDGIDIATLDPASLRSRLSALFQDFVRYDLSALDNIGIGYPSVIANRQAVRSAALVAGIDDLLAELPDGYDTMLSRAFAGPGGASQLSGGQWQRVALARALLRTEAELLILDEPTAGLDSTAEAEVHQAISSIGAGRAVLLISHRLALVRNADRIAVLSDGVVAEFGSHEDLVRAGGEYARRFALQAQGYQPVAS